MTTLTSEHHKYITTVTDIFSKTSSRNDITIKLPLDLAYETVNGGQWTNYVFLGELQVKLDTIARHRGIDFRPLFKSQIDLTTLAPTPITLKISY